MDLQDRQTAVQTLENCLARSLLSFNLHVTLQMGLATAVVSREASCVAADVVQLATLLCPPSSVSLASFGALLAQLPLASLHATPCASPQLLPTAQGSAICH